MPIRNLLNSICCLLCAGQALAGELVETSRRSLREDEKPMNFCFAHRFSDGTIYLSHSIGRHVVDERQANMFSPDDGRTWEKDGPIGGMNAFTSKNGRKCFVGCWDVVETNEHVVTVRVLDKSNRLQVTKSVLRMPEARQCLLHRNVLRLADGRLLLTGYCRQNPKTNKCDVFVIDSDDDGMTWRYLSTLPRVGHTQEGINESTLVQLKDGSVHIYARGGNKMYKGDRFDLLRFVSRDGGRTWDAGKTIAEYGVDPQAMLLSDGTLALLSGRPGLYLMLDRTGTGEHFVRHEVFSGMGSSYATLMETAPGKLLIVYDDSSMIHFKGDGPTNRIMAVTYDYRVGLASRESGRAEIAWTKLVCREEGRYIGWPTVCRLRNGDLLAVFSGDRDRHVCPYGKVQLVRSRDGGETWLAPKTIANGPLDDRDAGIVQLPNGEVVVTWFTSIAYMLPWEAKRHPEYARHHGKIPEEVVRNGLGYYMIRSADNGETWSEPLRLSNCDQSPHGPIVLKDGSLMQIGRRSRGGGDYKGLQPNGDVSVISVSRSTDGGRTWSYVCPELPAAPGENVKPNMLWEPHLAELPDGRLVGMIRCHEQDDSLCRPGHGYLRVSFSDDGGRTWTPMAKTPMLGLPPHLLPLPDGRLVCVYGRRLKDPGFGEFAMVSSDGGRTWDSAHEITLEPSFGDDLGYPASVLLPDGWILTVFYQQARPGEKTCLMATKWRLK